MNEQRIRKILRGAEWPAIILAGIVAFASIAYAAFSVGHLFGAYVKISPIESVLAVVSSVGMAVGLLLVIVTTDNQNARGLGAILLIAWVLLVLSMVALDSVMRAAQLVDPSKANGETLLVAPDALIEIGRLIGALLPALALAGVIGMVIALHDKTIHTTAAGASARYVSFAAKGVSIGASSFAAFYFGSSRGIDPVLAALCAALLESSFLWSYLALKNSRDRGDTFDVRMWSVCVFLFGTFITLVSIETLSTLGKIDVPIVKAFGEIGATLYVSAVGLTVALTVIVHLLTRAYDSPRAAASQPFAIRTAGAIRSARAGAAEIRGALTDKPAPVDRQLSAGMAVDSPLTPAQQAAILAEVMEENERLKGNVKTSAAGVKYATTAQTVDAGEKGWPVQDDLGKPPKA
jgi:hypothetical protein